MTFLKNIQTLVNQKASIPTEKRSGLTLLALSILLGLVAQTVLVVSATDQPDYWDIATWLSTIGNNGSPLAGLMLYALAGILFVGGISRLSPKKLELENSIAITPRQRPAPRFGFWFTSLGLAAFGFVRNLYANYPGYENGIEIILWLASIGLFSYSVLIDTGFRLPGSTAIKEWFGNHRRELLLIAIIVIGALLLRAIDLEAHPYPFTNDEGEMGNMGLCILSGNCSVFFTSRWAYQPTLAFMPTALSVGLLGNTAVAVRLVSVVTGALAVLFTYLFSRETFGKTTAWVAAILAATFAPHLHFSRLGFDNIIDSLSSALVLWLVVRGARRGAPLYYLAAGIVAGLCFYTYPGSRLSPILASGALAWIALRVPGFLHAQWRNLLIFAAAAMIVVAPIAGHYAAYPKVFMARIEREAVIYEGPQQDRHLTDLASVAPLVGQQVFKSALVFISTGGPYHFFGTPRPYFSPVAAILFMLGLALLLRWLPGPYALPLLAWFWAPVLLGSALTGGAPSHQRMLGSSMPAVIIAAVSLVSVFQAVKMLNPLAKRLAPLLLLGILILNGATDLRFYFDEYRNGRFFADLSNEITYESRRYIAPLGENGRFYLLGAPMTYTRFGSFHFFSPTTEKFDFNDVTREALAALPSDKDVLFLAIPEREADLRQIAEWLPGGQWITEQRRFQPQEALFFAYKVSKEQLQGVTP